MVWLSAKSKVSGQRRAAPPLSTMRLKPAANSCATISGSTPKLRMSRKRRAMRYTSPSRLPAALYQQAAFCRAPIQPVPAARSALPEESPVVSPPSASISRTKQDLNAIPLVSGLRSAMSHSTSTQSTPSASIGRTIFVAQPSSTMSGPRSAYILAAPIRELPSATIQSSAWYYAASRLRSPKATRSALVVATTRKPLPSAPHKQRAKVAPSTAFAAPAAEPSTASRKSTMQAMSKAPIRQTLPDPKSFGLTSGKRPTVGDTVSELSQSGAEICRTKYRVSTRRRVSGMRAARQPTSTGGPVPRASHKRQAKYRLSSRRATPDAKRRACVLAPPSWRLPAALTGAA